MAADPNGEIHVVKKDDFLAGIAKRHAFFHSIGFQFVTIEPPEETRLDTSYVMVNVHTQMRFERNPGQPVDLTSSSVYILFINGDAPKIVFTLTHEDLRKMMQEHGLLPGKH